MLNGQQMRFGIVALLGVIVGLAAGAQDNTNWPNGYESVASLEKAGEKGPVLKVVQGQSITFPGIESPMAKAICDEKNVSVQIMGLDSKEEYVLALTWWDADNKGRVQSIYMGSSADSMACIMPATPAKAFYEDKSTWATIMIPIPASAIADGASRLDVRRESGPDAVLNALCILKKSDKEPRKRILIVTGDDYPGHRWRQTAPEFAGILREDSRLEVSITEVPAFLGSPMLKHYDAILIHFKNYSERLPLGEDVWKGLRSYLDNGGGAVIAHFGCGAFQEWNDFVQLSGRIWNPKFRGHDPYGTFEVRVADGKHPITKDFKNFSTSDELYTCLDGTTPIHVLFEATSKVDHKPYPMGFAVNASRVFHCTLGHDKNALHSEGTRELYRRAVLWASHLSEN